MKNHDLIDSYFENTLTPKEQQIFNDFLQTDSDFKKEFEFQKDLKKVIALKQQEDLKSTLVEIEAKSQKNSTFMLIPKKWMIAASLLILVSVGSYGVKSIYYPSNESLYANYFEPSRNTVQPVVRGESLNTIEYRAFVAYESENYHKAINLFNSVKNPDQPYINFYKGMSFLGINKPTEAINLLHPLSKLQGLQGKNKGFNDRAKWYLALCYVKINETDNAISTLNSIVSNPESNFKKDEASELLNFLN